VDDDELADRARVPGGVDDPHPDPVLGLAQERYVAGRGHPGPLQQLSAAGLEGERPGRRRGIVRPGRDDESERVLRGEPSLADDLRCVRGLGVEEDAIAVRLLLPAGDVRGEARVSRRVAQLGADGLHAVAARKQERRERAQRLERGAGEVERGAGLAAARRQEGDRQSAFALVGPEGEHVHRDAVRRGCALRAGLGPVDDEVLHLRRGGVEADAVVSDRALVARRVAEAGEDRDQAVGAPCERPVLDAGLARAPRRQGVAAGRACGALAEVRAVREEDLGARAGIVHRELQADAGRALRVAGVVLHQHDRRLGRAEIDRGARRDLLGHVARRVAKAREDGARAVGAGEELPRTPGLEGLPGTRFRPGEVGDGHLRRRIRRVRAEHELDLEPRELGAGRMTVERDGGSGERRRERVLEDDVHGFGGHVPRAVAEQGAHALLPVCGAQRHHQVGHELA